MKEFKFKWYVVFNYLWLLIIEGGLVCYAFNVDLFTEVFVAISILIFLVTIVFFIRQMSFVYVITEEFIELKTKNKQIFRIDYNDIRQVIEKKRSIEISFRYKEKVKTIYLNAFLKEYKMFIDMFKKNLKDRELKEEIAYFN